MDLEKDYYFCSITCACLAGYMSVKANADIKDMLELKDEKIREKLLNEMPKRERGLNKDYL